MQFLNPRVYFAFYRIFGTLDGKASLLSFINGILDLKGPHQMVDFSIFDHFQAPKIAGFNNSYIDVKAEDGAGKSYIIEIQVLNVESFEKRILYNACKGYANQIRKGEDYHLLSDVIAITITNFVLFPARTATINSFKLRASDGDVYSDDLELVFAELPKLTQTIEQLTTIVEKWLFFLKHADDLSIVPESLSTVPEIKQAFDIANRASWSPKELAEQERYEITIQDQRGAISLAEKKARSEGKAEGIAIGEAKGESKGIQSVAINLLASGMSVEQVKQFTGLSTEQVKGLQ